jgi:hypothetical protein
MDISNITRVYNGKIGCMCGCLGKYTANPKFRDSESARLGRDLCDDEVSERSVKIIAKKVLSNPNVIFEGNYAFVRSNRMQVVYFTE